MTDMRKSARNRLMALWLMAPMIGLVFGGFAYLLFLFRDRLYIFALPFLSFIIGIVYLSESKMDKDVEEREEYED